MRHEKLILEAQLQIIEMLSALTYDPTGAPKETMRRLSKAIDAMGICPDAQDFKSTEDYEKALVEYQSHN